MRFELSFVLLVSVFVLYVCTYLDLYGVNVNNSGDDTSNSHWGLVAIGIIIPYSYWFTKKAI